MNVPWSVIEDYRCFGCSPHNPNGLQLDLAPHRDGLQATFRLERRFESYPGIVHGGLVGVICDEVMGNLIVLTKRTPAFTVSARTRYITPLLIGSEYRCIAKLSRGDRELIHASSEILDSDDQVCASSTASYQPFSMHDVRNKITLRDDEVAALTHAIANGVYVNGVPQ